MSRLADSPLAPEFVESSDPIEARDKRVIGCCCETILHDCDCNCKSIAIEGIACCCCLSIESIWWSPIDDESLQIVDSSLTFLRLSLNLLCLRFFFFFFNLSSAAEVDSRSSCGFSGPLPVSSPSRSWPPPPPLLDDKSASDSGSEFESEPLSGPLSSSSSSLRGLRSRSASLVFRAILAEIAAAAGVAVAIVVVVVAVDEEDEDKLARLIAEGPPATTAAADDEGVGVDRLVLLFEAPSDIRSLPLGAVAVVSERRCLSTKWACFRDGEET